jgi:hypothetical protein
MRHNHKFKLQKFRVWLKERKQVTDCKEINSIRSYLYAAKQESFDIELRYNASRSYANLRMKFYDN